MMNLCVILVVLSFVLVSSYSPWKLKLLRVKAASTSFLQMGLEMKVIEVPVQSDSSRYFSLVTSVVGEAELLRWYVASAVNGTARIEIVYEEGGVGKA